MTTSPPHDALRLRLRRARRRRPRAARRQGDRPRRDDAARHPRPRRLHDHDRRLPRVHGVRRRRAEGLDEEVDEHIARLEEQTGKRFGDPDDPLLVSVRSGAAVSMPGMMDTILNVGLNDVAVAGLARSTGNEEFARDCYRRLIQMYGETVDGIAARALQPRRPVERARGDLWRGDRAEGLPAGRARAAAPRDHRRLRLVELAARAGLPAHVRDPRRPRHGGQRRPDGLREQGRAAPRPASCSPATRPPASRASTASTSSTRRARTSSPASARRSRSLEMRERMPEAYDELLETMGSLERHYRDMQDIEFTVEEGKLYLLQTRTAKRTAAAAMKAAVDMRSEGLIDRDEAVARIDPAAARPASSPAARRERRVRGRGAGPQRVPGRSVREDRPRRRHGGGAREGGRVGDPRPLGDDARRHPRHEPGAGRAHGPRRHDVARGGRRARHGQAVRRRAARGSRSTWTREPCASAATSCSEGDVITIDGGTGRVIVGAVPLVPPDDQRGLRDDPRVGRRAAPPQGARERRQRRGRREGARVRRAGHRPLPHRAHVLRRRAAARRAGDDPRPRRGGPPRRARPAPAVPAVRLRGDLRGDGRAAGDDPAARPAAARVPAAARGGDGRAHARSGSRRCTEANPMLGTRGCRLGHPVARGLRDAGACDRARGEGGAGARGRAAARRDHAPARRLPRRARAAARAHRSA